MSEEKRFHEMYYQWWIVWKFWDDGTPIPLAAYPFHAAAKKHQKAMGNGAVITVAKTGFPKPPTRCHE